MASPMALRRRKYEWRFRNGAAVSRAKGIRRQATILGEDLVRLSSCEGDRETLLASIEAMREELRLAQLLAEEFDCADQHASEDSHAA
jgi:hypothetical protein